MVVASHVVPVAPCHALGRWTPIRVRGQTVLRPWRWWRSGRYHRLTSCCVLHADKTAADNFMVFQYAWMGDPVYFGDYPKQMRDTQAGLLPKCVPLLAQRAGCAGAAS